MLRLVLIVGLSVFLSGCMGDHGRMGDLSTQPNPAYIQAPPAVTPDQLSRSVEEIKTTVQSSTTAAQQSFSGLGAQITKGAENFDASLVKFGADVRATATAHLEANVKMADLMDVVATAVNSFRVEVNTQFKAQASAIAALEAQVNALAAAQVGYKNQLEQTTTSLSAGRDTIQYIQGSAKELVLLMRDQSDARISEARISAGVVLGVLVIAAIVIGYVLEQSRRRAEARARGTVTLLEELRK